VSRSLYVVGVQAHPGYLVAWVMALALACQSVSLASDTLLLHGHIYTGNPKMPWAEALSITGSRIEAIGTTKYILGRRGSNTKVTDLRGRTVIPGIVDSHIHILWGAFALHGFNLSTPDASITPDKGEMLIETIKTFAAAHPGDEVLFGRADYSTVPPSTPNRTLLDRAVADRPIVILNTSGHSFWLNSAAIIAAGITDYPVGNVDEERGVIRDASGHPSGVLLESAMELVERGILARMDVDQQLAMLRAATHYLNSYGITSVVNATGNLHELELLAALKRRGELTVRSRTAFGAVGVSHHLTPEFLASLEQARKLYHDDWVSANLVKFFTDGGTGLIPPLVYEPHEYAALVMELDRRGYQIMTHTTRSDGLHMVLDAYESVERAHGARDRRLRIEHVFLADEADIPRFGKLGVIAAMQPAFCCSDTGSFNYMPDPQPTDQWKSLQDSGATLAFSSDWPCSWPPDPFVGIEQATTREIWHSTPLATVAGQTFDGAAQAGATVTGGIYLPDERMTVRDALNAYTRGSAYAAFFDSRVGTLEVGKEADLAVLTQDPFAVHPEEIAKTHVQMTMVGGAMVFSAAL
jgi:predicted amidohydrolase YtcJ